MERSELLEEYLSGYQKLRDILDELPNEVLYFKPAPEKWSVYEIIIHISDSEANGYTRCRKIIAESGSKILTYDQDKWAENLNYTKQSLDNALDLFRMLRITTFIMLKSIGNDKWENFVVHPDNGKMTLDDWLNLYVNHVNIHVKQIKRNLEEWGNFNKEVSQ